MTSVRAIPLRNRIDDNELVILAKVAATGRSGFLMEHGEEPRALMILAEDGYLTHTLATGTSRTYSRFLLSASGRAALALVK